MANEYLSRLIHMSSAKAIARKAIIYWRSPHAAKVCFFASGYCKRVCQLTFFDVTIFNPNSWDQRIFLLGNRAVYFYRHNAHILCRYSQT